jgi:hypothetical protein
MMNKPTDVPMDNQQGSLSLSAIPGYDGYHASDTGEIFSTKHSPIPRKLTAHFHPGKRFKLHLRVKAAGKLRLVHRMIACIHVGRQLLENEVVNHKDADTLNNRVDNLEVVSHKENVAHAVRNGLYCSGPAWYKARGLQEPSSTRTSVRRIKRSETPSPHV